MANLQAIADANPVFGHASRNSGEPGYAASAKYVEDAMTAAGYSVHEQHYKFNYFAFDGIPTFTSGSTPLVLGQNWGPGQAPGTVSGQTLTEVNNLVLPPTTTPSSHSGCDPADFVGQGVSGHPVLIQRGTCTFAQKVANAAAAGATAVIIFNEGNTSPDRTGLLVGSLGSVPPIPVVFVDFATGLAFHQQIAAHTPPSPSIDIHGASNPNADDFNVIADSPGGDKNNTVVVDAHLDAIFGAGMLDNGSGSMAILDIAQMMQHVTPQNHLRFIWFGGEELGLFGSQFYVNNLTPTQASHIDYDLDADVFGTPNFLIGILDPAAPDLFSKQVPETFANNVYKPSQVARDQSVDFFNSQTPKVNHEFISPNGTDAIWFNRIGVPASGLLTGQDCCKTADEVKLFGGQTGNFEGNLGTTDGGCVDNPFRWCDNYPQNLDMNNMTLMSQAMANMVVRQAFNNKITSRSSNTAVYRPKTGIDSGTRAHPAQ